MAARSYSPRAFRHAVPIAVLYRVAGEKTWCEGRTENISRSGVLVRTDRVMEPQARIELLLSMPAEITTPFAGTTICHGRIVRAVAPSALEDRPAFAAAILDYETAHVADPRRI